MFRYDGLDWRHAYNTAHRVNTFLLATSAGAFVYLTRLWYERLVAPGAYPRGPLFTWGELAALPFR